MADITITATNVVPPVANTTVHYTPATGTISGEAIAAGETVCILASDGKVYKADANVELKSAVVGIAGNSAVVAGQRVDIITASPALAVGTHGVTVGNPVYQSMTPGKLTATIADLTAGSYMTTVGWAASSTTLQILISGSTTPVA